MTPLATYSPCCKIIRIGVRPPPEMHTLLCRDQHGGELGPTLLLYDQTALVAQTCMENGGRPAVFLGVES